MKKLKNILCVALLLVLVVPAAMMLVACGKETSPASSNRTLSMSINPELEFVVDKDNKVVSVSYCGNKDAGTIYANVNFENMDIEKAIEIFIENAAISGHIGLTASGSANQVSINVNGYVDADIESLEKLAKEKVENTFDSLGIDISVVISDFSDTELKNQLVEKAKELYNSYTESELKNMSKEDLIGLINDKQKEYKDLTLNKINEVKTEISAKLANSSDSLAVMKTTLENTKGLLDQAQKNLDTAKNAGLDTSALQSLLDNAKVAYEEAYKAYEEAEKLIIEAKKKLAEAEKVELLVDFKAEVSANESTLKLYLSASKASGKITEAQYDYWVKLINDNKTAA